MTKQTVTSFVTKKILGIDHTERYEYQPIQLEQRARDTLSDAGAEIYLEEEPTVVEWLKEQTPTTDDVVGYLRNLFPPIGWLPRYNLRWLLGDVVAGITIGLVVVPQAMAYALLAKQTASVGLYTSFTGAVLYWLFGTSKDIVIGTTAVGSLLVGQVVTRIQAAHGYSNLEIAHTLSMLAGAVMLAIGLLRLGCVIEFIPYIPISAFVTAASLTIMSTQVPTALGLQGVDTSTPPCFTIVTIFRQLHTIRIDAVIGISTMGLLFTIKGFCGMMEKRRPASKRTWSFISSLRLTFVVLLFTLISYLINRQVDESEFRIVGPIVSGFTGAQIPRPNPDLVKVILPELPAVVIILVIEHVAIAKSMGRVHGYTITPSQEIVALGGANLLSPFVGGYVCTGSFSASAVLSKAGSRTPLAGLFSAAVLVVVLYALTGVFYYIPNACLAGLIIHAVCSLVIQPQKLYRYWQLSPIELCIWVICFVIGLCESLEYCIYVGVALSIALVFVRMARTKGQFLGKVRARRVKETRGNVGSDTSSHNSSIAMDRSRTMYAPFRLNDGMNPAIQLLSPHPGVFIYRLSEGLNYANQAFHMETLQTYLMAHTKRTSDEGLEHESDRIWNAAASSSEDCDLPHLRAIVLDFGSVNNLDITALQGLIDLRKQLDQYTYPDAVEWHFASVDNRWTRRALAASGFGYPSAQSEEAVAAWKPIYSIADTLVSDESTPLTKGRKGLAGLAYGKSESLDSSQATLETRQAAINGVDRPFFHIDLYEAVQSAVRDARGRDQIDS